MQKSHCIDPGQFRTAHAAWAGKQTTDPARATKPGKKPFQPKFVKVPWLWLDALDRVKAPASAYVIATHLLYEAWRHNSDKVKLANVSLSKRGTTRWGKYTGLQYLRRAGLVAVEERAKASPIVTLRYWRA